MPSDLTSGVLLGTRSFGKAWMCLRTLSVLVIVKLPFDVPPTRSLRSLGNI